MGILSSLKNALGLNTPVVPREPGPFALSDAGQKRLDSLPEGHGLHIGTRRAEFGRTVTVDEGELQGPPPDGYERITMGDRDLHRLRGLVLDYQHSGWHVSTHFELRAKETPNPDGRLYLCNRWLAEGRPMFFTADKADLPDLPALLLGISNVESVLVRDNTVTVERSKDASWDAIDSGVNTALRRYLLGCGHRLTNEAVAKSGLLSEIQAVLAQTILPAIHADGGDLELVGVDNGVVRVRLQGACRSCPASSATLKHGVERALLEAFPDRVTAVEQV